MRKRFFTSYLIISTVSIIVAGIILLVAHSVHYSSMCQSNLKQIALVIFMYSQDYDQKLPPAIIEGNTVGWSEALSPYNEGMRIFQCPSIKNDWQLNPNLPGFTDYWMNRNLSGANQAELTNLRQIILSGDGDGNSSESTASYTVNQLPASGLFSLGSPAKRHLGGANYAFLDGHVKWLKPEQVSQLPTSKKHPVYTFSIQ